LIGDWKLSSLVCKDFHQETCKLVRTVTLNRSCPKNIITQTTQKFQSLHVLILDALVYVTDEAVLEIFFMCKSLRYLSLAYCSEITATVLKEKPEHLQVSIHGCWKILSPHPSISPSSVVELQLLSLRSHTAVGFEKMLAFVTPTSKPLFEQLLRSQNFQDAAYYSLFQHTGFSIHKARLEENSCVMLVSIKFGDEKKRVFLWHLSRGEEIYTPVFSPSVWLTERIEAFGC